MPDTMKTEKMHGGRNPAKINTSIFLPDDVIEEIISRLPAKSLLRFRSVRKQWLSLISHPNFVQSNLKHVLSHHQLYDHHQKLMLLLPCYGKPHFGQLYSVDYESIGGSSSINTVKFDLPVSIKVPKLSFFGSCNGLLCIGIYTAKENGGFQYMIWNPLLRIHRTVADFDYPCSYFADYPIGFGYDSVADDYKLVSVYLHRKLVNVYSLKTNSSRSFPLQPPDIYYVCCDRRIGKFFNGSLYWLANMQRAKPPMLIWFDLKDEKFRMVEVPVDRDTSLAWGSELSVARGCICIFTVDSNNLYRNLLVMKVDESNVISWSVGANLEPPIGLQKPHTCIRPICVTADGGVLMSVKNNLWENYKLIIHNPQKGIIKNIPPVHGFSTWYEGITYHETLVSPL